MTVEAETTAVATRPELAMDTDLVPTMVSDIRAAKARLAQLQEFVREVMVEGEDYGVIPGTKKPVLLKPGAEKLCEIYGYAQRIEIIQRIEDWEAPFFHYEARCDLVSKRTGAVVGSGVGSCNSREARYRWRDAQRLCPKCQAPAIIKGKEEYGGGWLCFAKKGGCGAKFVEKAPEILNQPLGKIENDDVFTLVNTLLKMAKKRAVIDATLSVTRSSALFTQDAEDFGNQDSVRQPGAKRDASQGPEPDADGAGQDDAPITDKERSGVIAECKKHGKGFDDLKVWCTERNISTLAIPRKLHAEVLAWAKEAKA